MSDINLLPQELKPRTYAINLSKTLRKVALYFLVVFLIILMLLGATYIALNIRQGSVLKSQQALETQVKNLQETEQKLILIQDRLRKIDTILGSQNNAPGIDSVDTIIKNLPENVVVRNVEINGGAATVGIVTDSSDNLSRFFSVLSNLQFSQVLLASFLYDQELGYRIGVQVIK